jgi:hypothetical protein
MLSAHKTQDLGGWKAASSDRGLCTHPAQPQRQTNRWCDAALAGVHADDGGQPTTHTPVSPTETQTRRHANQTGWLNSHSLQLSNPRTQPKSASALPNTSRLSETTSQQHRMGVQHGQQSIPKTQALPAIAWTGALECTSLQVQKVMNNRTGPVSDDKPMYTRTRRSRRLSHDVSNGTALWLLNVKSADTQMQQLHRTVHE